MRVSGRSRSRRRWLPVVGALALIGAGCDDGGGCKTFAAPSLRVHVTDATGADVCDAVVTAQEGRTTVTLQPPPPDATPCRYAGPWEEVGTFRVEASARGLVAVAEKVKVTADACHVRPQDVTLVLLARGGG